jgi:hypothetical protein
MPYYENGDFFNWTINKRIFIEKAAKYIGLKLL